MQTSLKVTFYSKPDRRVYNLEIDTTDSGIVEIYVKRSVVIEDEPDTYKLRYIIFDTYESAQLAFSQEAIDNYYKEDPNEYPKTITGLIRLMAANGPEWAGALEAVI